jgi:membrane-bound serine protease (ClpP class)
MWIVAGVLLGLVVLASVAGFHAGPHLHVAAGIVGVLAAAWLVAMAVSGRSGPVLWVLFSADLAISAGMGVMGGVGLAHRGVTTAHARLGHLEGAEGVAVTDLEPDGIVRVRGEQWSAVSANGTVRAGTKVQVIRGGGVRLEVWGEEAEVDGGGGLSGRRQQSEELGT